MSFSLRKSSQLLAVVALLLTAMPMQNASADLVTVTVTNNAPNGGVYLTPVWVGFHDGSFDSYDGGTASATELERLAEDGNTAPISATFGAGGTLAGSGSQAASERVQSTLGGGPIAPGQSVSQTLNVSGDGSNNYFSYASMVLPSNDYYIANGNPFAHSIADLLANGNDVTFDVFSVNDAGTEVNDFAFSAGNGLFGALGLPGGQGGPNQGADQNGVNANVLFPYSGFLNTPAGADADPNFALLNFGSLANYPRGVATVTISRAVPEPTTAGLFAIAGIGMLVRRRR